MYIYVYKNRTTEWTNCPLEWCIRSVLLLRYKCINNALSPFGLVETHTELAIGFVAS